MTTELNGRIDNILKRIAHLESRCEKELAAAAQRRESTWSRIVDTAAKFAMPVALIVGAALINHEVRINSIETSDKYEWLRADMDEIKLLLRGYDERLRLIEIKVNK